MICRYWSHIHVRTDVMYVFYILEIIFVDWFQFLPTNFYFSDVLILMSSAFCFFSQQLTCFCFRKFGTRVTLLQLDRYYTVKDFFWLYLGIWVFSNHVNILADFLLWTNLFIFIQGYLYNNFQTWYDGGRSGNSNNQRYSGWSAKTTLQQHLMSVT